VPVFSARRSKVSLSLSLSLSHSHYSLMTRARSREATYRQMNRQRNEYSTADKKKVEVGTFAPPVNASRGRLSAARDDDALLHQGIGPREAQDPFFFLLLLLHLLPLHSLPRGTRPLVVPLPGNRRAEFHRAERRRAREGARELETRAAHSRGASRRVLPPPPWKLRYNAL